MTMFGMTPNIGDSSLVAGDQPYPQMPQGLPQPKIKRGMFGGGVSIDPGAFLAAFAAGMGNPAGMAALQAIHQRRLDAQRQAYDDEQYQRHRQDQLSDQISLYDYKNAHPGQPDGEFEQALIASGVQPGTPQWAEAMKTRVGNILDPVVMTPQGPMLRSMVMGAIQPQILQTLPPGTKPIGGPTPQASGSFSGY